MMSVSDERFRYMKGVAACIRRRSFVSRAKPDITDNGTSGTRL